jgi:hypothetical protein
MAVVTTQLIPAKAAENVQTTQYTVATGTRAIIDKFTVTNVGGASAQFSINICPLSGAAANSNLIVDARTIAVGECYTLPEVVGHNLLPGSFISTLASAATTLTIMCSGREIT